MEVGLEFVFFEQEIEIEIFFLVEIVEAELEIDDERENGEENGGGQANQIDDEEVVIVVVVGFVVLVKGIVVC